MLRLFAIFALFLSSSGLLMAGLELYSAVQQARSATKTPTRDLPQMDAVVVESSNSQRVFAPIFGTVPRDAPDGQDKARQLDASDFGYKLKGLIVSGDMRWAILGGSHDSDIVVREGEEIDDFTVSQIHGHSVDIALGTELFSLNFSEDHRTAVIEATTIATATQEGMYTKAAELWGEKPLTVMFQGMSQDDLTALLSNAKNRRHRKGWLP